MPPKSFVAKIPIYLYEELIFSKGSLSIISYDKLPIDDFARKCDTLIARFALQRILLTFKRMMGFLAISWLNNNRLQSFCQFTCPSIVKR